MICQPVSVAAQVRVVRIFNTYGPRMALDDGRVVSNFVAQALTGTPLTIYGHGEQTRSFQYVSDLIEGAPQNYLLPSAHVASRSCCCLDSASDLWSETHASNAPLRAHKLQSDLSEARLTHTLQTIGDDASCAQ